jgi:DNA-binding transcriptional LysR family regulator
MPSPVMNLAWIDSFLAVAEYGSMTAAADALHLSQPRISSHIASLESHLGVTLFDRRARGSNLTTLGAVFHARAVSATEELRRGLDELAAAQNTLRGRVHIGSYPGASAVLVAPVLERFRVQYPDVEVTLVEGDSHPIASALSAGEIDWALLAADVPIDADDLVLRPLCREKVVLVRPVSSGPQRAPAVELEHLRDSHVIVSGFPSQQITDYVDRLRAAGVGDSRVSVMAMPTTIVALVRAGMGVGVLGAFAASVSTDSRTMAVDLPGDVWHRDVLIAHRRGHPVSPGGDAFIRMLRADLHSLTVGLTA